MWGNERISFSHPTWCSWFRWFPEINDCNILSFISLFSFLLILNLHGTFIKFLGHFWLIMSHSVENFKIFLNLFFFEIIIKLFQAGCIALQSLLHSRLHWGFCYILHTLMGKILLGKLACMTSLNYLCIFISD